MDTAIEKELLDLEKQYWQAIQDRDIDTAMKLTHYPCIVAGASGVASVERDRFKQMMSAAKYELKGFSFSDAKVTSLADDVAVVAYKIHEEISVEGKPMTLDTADSSTWVKEDGHWVCAAHTESLLGDPFGRDR